jgi:hypothetical protein
MLIALVKKYKANPNGLNKEGRNALYTLLLGNTEEHFKCFAYGYHSLGMKLDIEDVYGNTLLHAAASLDVESVIMKGTDEWLPLVLSLMKYKWENDKLDLYFFLQKKNSDGETADELAYRMALQYLQDHDVAKYQIYLKRSLRLLRVQEEALAATPATHKDIEKKKMADAKLKQKLAKVKSFGDLKKY